MCAWTAPSSAPAPPTPGASARTRSGVRAGVGVVQSGGCSGVVQEQADRPRAQAWPRTGRAREGAGTAAALLRVPSAPCPLHVP